MNDVVKTLEGWYCLHDFRLIDWASWKTVPQEEQQEMIKEYNELVSSWKLVEENKNGSQAIYHIVGQKADIMHMILRPTMEEIAEVETAINKLRITEYLLPSYSYVSVVELSNYLPAGQDPYKDPAILARLYPILPAAKHVCFYPMDKKREGDDNWYMLPMEDRQKLMRSHGMIGRQYAGKVKQIISGSVGMDDYEWGVTLFSDDVLQFKKLVYEMRFDEVSARYGVFGSFFIGNIITAEGFSNLLAVQTKEEITL